MGAEPRALRVALLVGGTSAEREVSLNSGAQVAAALERLASTVVTIDTGDDGFIGRAHRQRRRRRLHLPARPVRRRRHRPGTVSSYWACRTSAPGVLASALAMDKVMSKHIFAQAGLATPGLPRAPAWGAGRRRRDHRALGRQDRREACERGLGDRRDHRRTRPLSCPPRWTRPSGFDSTVLVERFVTGAEVTVGVLGNDEPEVLPTLEIVPEHEFYDYESKYVPGMSRHIIPARVSEAARGVPAAVARGPRGARLSGHVSSRLPSSKRTGLCGCSR